MALFRKDPFGPAWVLISPERGLEPSDFGSVGRPVGPSPLSPGNEEEFTEILALRPSSSGRGSPDWRARVIEHPAALLEPGEPAFLGRGPFRYAEGRGRQEIIVEHPDSAMTLDRMPPEHLVEVLRLYRDRLALLAGSAGIRHVQLTRSEGEAAGALYAHPHAVVLGVPIASRWVEEEFDVARAYHEAAGSCIFCDVIREELAERERVVTFNDAFVALAPFAAKTPFETWILPRRHSATFSSVTGNALPELADLLQTVLRAINSALDHPPFNLLMHTLPAPDDSYHWHIEILPRLTRQAGFDWSKGFYVNPTPPEDAVRFLREALALQVVGE